MMRTFALVFAALTCMAAPALAAPVVNADKPIVLAQSTTIVTRDRDRGPSLTIRTGDRDRFERRRHRHFRAHDRGCRTVTIRERRGGTTVVKKIRRC
jgi:hypothetical protein